MAKSVKKKKGITVKSNLSPDETLKMLINLPPKKKLGKK
jgi:hypothetical protein